MLTTIGIDFRNVGFISLPSWKAVFAALQLMIIIIKLSELEHPIINFESAIINFEYWNASFYKELDLAKSPCPFRLVSPFYNLNHSFFSNHLFACRYFLSFLPVTAAFYK